MTQHTLQHSQLEELQPLLDPLAAAAKIKTFTSQRRDVILIEWGHSLIRLGARSEKALQLTLLEGNAQDYYALYHALGQPPVQAAQAPESLPPYLEQHRLLQDPAFLAQGWSALFAKPNQPLALELGCGYGHFMAEYAPETAQNFLALDIVSKVLRKAHRRLHALDNVRVAKLDGVFLLREWILPQSLKEIFILFPDPWPKERHQNRRSVRPDTLKVLASALQPDGRLIFVSDNQDYAQQVRELLEACPYFQAQPFPELVIRTKYERKWRQQNKEIYHLAYGRQEHPDLPPAQNWKPLSPHAEFPLQNFEFQRLATLQLPRMQELNGLTLKINDIYLNSEDALLRLIIAEPGAMAQSLWLKVSHQGHLKLSHYTAMPFMARQEAIFQCIQSMLQGQE